MANIASLSVSIFAKTSAFQKGLRGVKKSLKDLRSTVFSTGSAFVTAATGGGIAYFLQQQAEAIDKSAKLADRLNISTESVQALGEAAQESGLDMGGLTSGIEMLMRNVGKAGGSGDPVAILTSVSDELAGVTDTAAKFAVVNKLFGRQGAGMLNFLDGLRGKLKAAEEEGKKFGTSFSRLDAAKVEQANIAMGDLKDLLAGIATQIVIDLAPKVQALAEMFIGAATEGGNMGDRVSGAMQSIYDKIAPLLRFTDYLRAGFNGILGALSAIAGGAALLGSKAAGFLGLDKTASALETIEETLRGTMVDSLDQMWRSAENAATSGEKFAGFLQMADVRATEIAKNTAAAKTSMDKTGVSSLGKLGGKTESAGSFKQIDLARTVVGGLGGGKKSTQVSDPENKKTNEILQRIERNLKGGNTAVFA